MEYSIQEFERDFMVRTLAMLKQYKGQYEATFLLNCLVGLLIVPKERAFDKIPDDRITSNKDWGIGPHVILSEGAATTGSEYTMSLRDFVQRLRNAIAHFHVLPHHRHGSVCAFEFWDRNGFRALVTTRELREFATNLARYLEENWRTLPKNLSQASDRVKGKSPQPYSISIPERVYIIDSPKGLKRQCLEIASTCGEFYVFGDTDDLPSVGATESTLVVDDKDRRNKIVALALHLTATLPPDRRLSIYTNDNQLTTDLQHEVQELAEKRLAHFGVYPILERRPNGRPSSRLAG